MFLHCGGRLGGSCQIGSLGAVCSLFVDMIRSWVDASHCANYVRATSEFHRGARLLEEQRRGERQERDPGVESGWGAVCGIPVTWCCFVRVCFRCGRRVGGESKILMVTQGEKGDETQDRDRKGGNVTTLNADMRSPWHRRTSCRGAGKFLSLPSAVGGRDSILACARCQGVGVSCPECAREAHGESRVL